MEVNSVEHNLAKSSSMIFVLHEISIMEESPPFVRMTLDEQAEATKRCVQASTLSPSHR